MISALPIKGLKDLLNGLVHHVIRVKHLIEQVQPTWLGEVIVVVNAEPEGQLASHTCVFTILMCTLPVIIKDKFQIT